MLPSDVRSGIDGIVNQASAGISHYVQEDFLPRIGGWLMHLPWLILVPIFAFFLLRDADLLRRAALGLFPGRQLRWRGDVFFEDVNRTLAAYIRAQLLASLVVAILCTAGFLWIGLQYGVVLGIAAGLLELLPLVGPLIIATLAVAVGGLDSLSRAMTAAAFVLVVRIAQDYFIYPRLVGREIPLHPMAVILAILCGGEIAGVAGVFLAVPVLAVLTVAFRHWRAHQRGRAPRPASSDRCRPTPRTAQARAGRHDRQVSDRGADRLGRLRHGLRGLGPGHQAAVAIKVCDAGRTSRPAFSRRPSWPAGCSTRTSPRSTSRASTGSRPTSCRSSWAARTCRP